MNLLPKSFGTQFDLSAGHVIMLLIGISGISDASKRPAMHVSGTYSVILNGYLTKPCVFLNERSTLHERHDS
jgi:hypothetical protein